MHTGFSSMVQDISLGHNEYPKSNSEVCRADYLSWQQRFVFEALQGLRYGQSFCNHFDITDHILFYERDPEWADWYIQRYYVV